MRDLFWRILALTHLPSEGRGKTAGAHGAYFLRRAFVSAEARFACGFADFRVWFGGGWLEVDDEPADEAAGGLGAVRSWIDWRSLSSALSTRTLVTLTVF